MIRFDADVLTKTLPIACALLLVRFVAGEAIYQRAQRTANGLRFPAGLGLRLIFRLGGPFMLFVAYKMMSQAKSTFDWGASIVVAILALGCLLGEPGLITVTSTGIVQSNALRLRTRQIGWTGAAARHIPALREVLVIGSDGTSITHSQHHVGQSEFIHEIQRHGVHVQGTDAIA